MVFCLFTVFAIAIGGIALSYLYDDESTLVFRIGTGVPLGMAVFGFAGTILAAAAGLSTATVLAATLVAASPAALFFSKTVKENLSSDINQFRLSTLSFYTDLNLTKGIAILSYACLFLMLWFFFQRAMLVMPDGGIGTGAVNNLGDLPFHLLVINGFTTGQSFPPDNPIFSGTTLSYAFITDLVAAMLTFVGASVREAMFVQNFLLAISIVVLLSGLTLKLTKSVFAAAIAPLLLVFAGGLGFLMFFSDSTATDAGVLKQIFQLNTDYTLRGGTIWRWGNPLTTLFVTQRTLLLGLSMALIVFAAVFGIFDKLKARSDDENSTVTGSFGIPFDRYAFLVVPGMLAGLIPLIHTHTFLVVAGFSAIIAVASLQHWRSWAIYFAGMAAAAIPQIIYIKSGSATAVDQFFGWDLAWDNGEHNALWFWFVNTGVFIPLLLVAVWLLVRRYLNGSNLSVDVNEENRNARRLLLFFLPFALCFFAANTFRLAPWIWDNVKILIYWYIGAIPIVAWLLAEMRSRIKGAFVLVPALLVLLTLSGWLDVWRVASSQIEHQILPPTLVGIARDLKPKISRDTLILTAPEYATLPVLTGSRWFLGYTGHVWSHGIAGQERESIVKRIYAGGDEARKLILENKIDLIVIGPQERHFTIVNEQFFEEFPIAVQAGDYRVFQVTQRTAE